MPAPEALPLGFVEMNSGATAHTAATEVSRTKKGNVTGHSTPENAQAPVETIWLQSTLSQRLGS